VVVSPVESGMDGVAGLPSVKEELPVPEMVMAGFRVYVSVPVIVAMPGTVKVRVPVLVVCETVAVGPSGEVKLEKDDGETGEPSVEDVLPPIGTGIVTVYVVPVEMVTLRVTGMLLETPVGPTKLDVLLVPVTGETGVELEPVPYPDGL
jgi:hypothetical protein